MAFDYDKLYKEQPNALGEPSVDFVSFFDIYSKANARVLDVGCGQGRDALFIAQKGHIVTGVDFSKAGISFMLAQSKKQKLKITGIVANILNYQPEGLFDIIIIDRVLHMLDQKDRFKIFSALAKHVADNGHLLVADEKSNLVRFQNILANDERCWQVYIK